VDLGLGRRAALRVRRYRDVQDYLARLEEMVGFSQVTPPIDPLGPMALPDAFDHLDLAWRLLTGDLVRVPRAAMAAKLTQPVARVEEFESRCSALADLLNALNMPKPATLHNLKARLGELLGDEAGRAQAAIDTSRAVVALRAGQHTRAPIPEPRRPESASDWRPISVTRKAPGITCAR